MFSPDIRKPACRYLSLRRSMNQLGKRLDEIDAERAHAGQLTAELLIQYAATDEEYGIHFDQLVETEGTITKLPICSGCDAALNAEIIAQCASRGLDVGKDVALLASRLRGWKRRGQTAKASNGHDTLTWKCSKPTYRKPLGARPHIRKKGPRFFFESECPGHGGLFG